jgi:hypothetical protein
VWNLGVGKTKSKMNVRQLRMLKEHKQKRRKKTERSRSAAGCSERGSMTGFSTHSGIAWARKAAEQVPFLNQV